MGTTVTVLGVKLTEPRLDKEGIRGDGDATLVVGATTTLKLQQCFVMSDELVGKYMANELASYLMSTRCAPAWRCWPTTGSANRI